MKRYLIITFLTFCHACFGQKVEVATSIAPEDLGAYKWILSGSARVDEVVIFRVTRIRGWPNGKVTKDIYDTVCYSPGEKETGTAFFFDPEYFNTSRNEEPKWHWKALGGTGWIEGKYAGHSSSGGDKAEINFESKSWGKTKIVFETLIKPYDEASRLYEELPQISPDGGWRWAGSPKKQTEQDAAPKADN